MDSSVGKEFVARLDDIAASVCLFEEALGTFINDLSEHEELLLFASDTRFVSALLHAHRLLRRTEHATINAALEAAMLFDTYRERQS